MPAIENIVVVMFENRSYDNVLGWRGPLPLDASNEYDGATYPLQASTPRTIGGSGQQYPATSVPMIDPNETLNDMAQQYLGPQVDPKTVEMPYANYPPSSSDNLMGGFAANYASAKGVPPENIGDVMTFLTAEQLPVTAFLANQFGVCDQWFASVPSQTFVNRLFAFCAAPQIINGDPHQYSVVDDVDHKFHLLALVPGPEVIGTDSICSRLDANDISWKLYFHDYSIAVLTIPYVAGAAKSSASQNNVSTFDHSDWGTSKPTQLAGPAGSTFVDDVQNGTLPAFSFIEPRYAFDQFGIRNHLPPSCNHPGPGNYGVLTHSDPSDQPIDATGGELLLMTIYNLLRNSSYWEKTLLLVTYDEAGGVYDHVPPASPATPPATAIASTTGVELAVPDAISKDDQAANHFPYTVFGGRVPAVVVSPSIEAASTLNDANGRPFDHSSIVRTAFELFNVDGSLTNRDAAAPSLGQFLGSSSSNSAGVFSGTIVPSPSAIILTGGRIIDVPSKTLLASAGPATTLTATGTSLTTWKNEGRNWLTVAASPVSVAPGITAWTISIDRHALGDFGDAYLTGEITISGAGAADVTVPVSLYLN